MLTALDRAHYASQTIRVLKRSVEVVSAPDRHALRGGHYPAESDHWGDGQQYVGHLFFGRACR